MAYMDDELNAIDASTWPGMAMDELVKQREMITARMNKLIMFSESAGLTPSVRSMGVALQQATEYLDYLITEKVSEQQNRLGKLVK